MPTAAEYNQAIQNLRVTARDEELKAGQPVLNPLGLPLEYSGNFAVVYQVQCPKTGKTRAVKCFTREVDRRRERYESISQYLRRTRLPFTVDFEYQEQGLRINGCWHPIVKMDWVEGIPLDQFLSACLTRQNYRGALRALGERWVKLARRLHQAEVAHGDLQHGNVLLVQVAGTEAYHLRLVDYDGMCVPGLEHTSSHEDGLAAYQHPERPSMEGQGLEIDRFSHLLIYTSLQGLLAGGPQMWQRFHKEDRLLLGPEDFRDPQGSEAFRTLWQLEHAAVRALTGHLALAAVGPVARVPPLSKLVTPSGVTPLTGEQQVQVVELLGSAAPTEEARYADTQQVELLDERELEPLLVTCQCGQRFRAASHLWGKRVACPVCDAALDIPDLPVGLSPSLAPDYLSGIDEWVTPELVSPRRLPGPARPQPEDEETPAFPRSIGQLFSATVAGCDRLLVWLVGEENTILLAVLRPLLALGGLLAPCLLLLLACWHVGAYLVSRDASVPPPVAAGAVAEAEPVVQTPPAAAVYQVRVVPPEAELRALGSGATVSGMGGERTVTVAAPAGNAPIELVSTLSGYAEQRVQLQPIAGESGSMTILLPRTLPTITNSIGMTLVQIPAGEFLMGSPESDPDATSWEKPQHRVRITKPFYLGVHPVTQEEYERVMGNNPSVFLADGRLPVEHVSWQDAVEFCERLTSLPAERSSGRVYRLPTEAEWEYACRAGTTTRFHFGDDLAEFREYGWSADSWGRRTHPVGQKRPNAWGLHDMHGNVSEWCADWFDADYYRISPLEDPSGPPQATHRVARGGSGWHYRVTSCRSAVRSRASPESRGEFRGFRVAFSSVDPSFPTGAGAAAAAVEPVVQTPPAAAVYQVRVVPPEAELRALSSGATVSGMGGERTVTVAAPAGNAPIELVATLSGYAEQRVQLQPIAGESGSMTILLPRTLPTITNSIGMTLVQIPAGEFLMGSPESDPDAASPEKPQHRVRITKPFYLGVHPVTQSQWESVMGSNPSAFSSGGRHADRVSDKATADFPVERVSWNDVQEFLRRLNRQSGGAGVVYRLPTEAEWEYACRAGNTASYFFGDDAAELREYAWYNVNSGGRTHRVGQKRPNAWGLYDMHGNVWEWCADWYDIGYYANSPLEDPTGPESGSYRVYRGGSWRCAAGGCRSARRVRGTPGYRGVNLGFRVAFSSVE